MDSTRFHRFPWDGLPKKKSVLPDFTGFPSRSPVEGWKVGGGGWGRVGGKMGRVGGGGKEGGWVGGGGVRDQRPLVVGRDGGASSPF